MIETVLAVVFAGSAIWVYLDATSHGIGKDKDTGGLFNLSAGAWGAVTLGLWIIGFPGYLIKRRALIERAKSAPVEVKGRGVKTAIFAVLGGLWVLGTLPGGG